MEAKRPGQSRADFVSGSRDFVEGLVQQLCEEGLTKATIHTRKNGRTFYVKYGQKDCVKLFHLFYDDVDESIFLNRKYERFKSASEVSTLQEAARSKAQWDKYFEGYKDYVQTTGQQPPWSYTRHKRVSIGKWLYREILPKKNTLSPEQIKLLEELGLDWNLQQLPDYPQYATAIKTIWN